MTRARALHEIESRLRDRGVRLTPGRHRVIEALTTVEGPRSASELSMLMGPRIPLSSLYRTLAVLEEAGVVTPHLGLKGTTRFELAEWLTGHHHHLVCVNCGSVADVVISEPTERRVVGLVREIAVGASFEPIDHSLEIEGRCVRCA